MTQRIKTAAILLAAGQSQRFGPTNKLLAELRGKPLIAHSADLLRNLAPDHLIACYRDADLLPHLSGFDAINTKGVFSDSLKAAVTRAQDLRVSRLLIMLGDMPFVPLSHLRHLIDHTGRVVLSESKDGIRTPPAAFDASMIPTLLRSSHDQGLRDILKGHDVVRTRASSDQLRDIDTQADLNATQSL